MSFFATFCNQEEQCLIADITSARTKFCPSKEAGHQGIRAIKRRVTRFEANKCRSGGSANLRI